MANTILTLADFAGKMYEYNIKGQPMRIYTQANSGAPPFLDIMVTKNGTFTVSVTQDDNDQDVGNMAKWTDESVQGEVRSTQNGNDFQLYSSKGGLTLGAICLRFHAVQDGSDGGMFGPWFNWETTDAGKTLRLIGQNSENPTLEGTATRVGG